jgi:hypothetical protein
MICLLGVIIQLAADILGGFLSSEQLAAGGKFFASFPIALSLENFPRTREDRQTTDRRVLQNI